MFGDYLGRLLMIVEDFILDLGLLGYFILIF